MLEEGAKLKNNNTGGQKCHFGGNNFIKYVYLKKNFKYFGGTFGPPPQHLDLPLLLHAFSCQLKLNMRRNKR
jgi:hypothetical protein